MVVRGVPARRQRRCRMLLPAAVLLVLFAAPGPARALTPPSLAPPAASTPPSPIGVHSMLYLTDPWGAKQAMFRQAAEIGASTIRVDVELSAVFPDPSGPPDWSGVDQYVRLARRYRLRVLADLVATPWYLADCPAGTPFASSYLCPSSDPDVWGRDAGAIAAHARGVIDVLLGN
jgi:hypothetical protein